MRTRAKQSQEAAAARRLYKQTQFGVFSSDEGCPCEQTNPISGPAGAPRTPNRAKQSQLLDFGLRSAGTAPGNRHPPSAELSDWGLGTDLRRDGLCGPPGQEPVVQTNPIWPAPGCQTGCRGAKRATSPRCPASGNKADCRVRLMRELSNWPPFARLPVRSTTFARSWPICRGK